MNEAESLFLSIQNDIQSLRWSGKHCPAYSRAWIHLVNFYLNIFLTQYLYLSSVLTLWDLNALCDQKHATICTFKIVEIQLLALNL